MKKNSQNNRNRSPQDTELQAQRNAGTLRARISKAYNAFRNPSAVGSSSFAAEISAALTGRRNWSAEPGRATPWILSALAQWDRLAYVATVAEKTKADGTVEQVDNPLLPLLRSDISEASYHRGLIDSLFREGWWAVEKVGLLGESEVGPRPKFLNPLNPARLSPYTWDGLERVTSWQYKLPLGGTRLIPADAVISFGEFPDPSRPGCFISRLQALLLTVSADHHGRRHNEVLMRNSGHIGTIFNYEDATPDELALYKLSADAMLSGAHNSGTSAHLTGVKSVTDLGTNQKDLDWLQAMKLNREEIFATYGVPLEVIGLGTTTFRNKEQAKRDLWEETLMPLGKEGLISPLMHALPEIFGDIQLRHKFDEVPALGEDRSRKIVDYRNLIDAGVPSDQAASLTGLPIEIEEPPPEPAPEPAPKKDAPVEVPGRELRGVSPSDREIIRSSVWKAIVDEGEPHERKLSKILEKFFYDQRSTVLKNLDEAIEDEIEGAKAFGVEQTKGIEPTEPEKEFADMLLAGPDWDKLLVDQTTRTLTQVFLLGMEQLDAEESDTVARDAFRSSQDKLLLKVNDTTKTRLALTRRTIEEGILEGLPIDEVVANVEADLKRVFQEAQKSRSKTIARTEVGRGLNGGRLAGMNERGVKLHEWLSSRDGVVRDSHVGLDGIRVRVGSSFKPGVSLTYPHDPSAPASETVNCRCTTIPVIEDL